MKVTVRLFLKTSIYPTGSICSGTSIWFCSLPLCDVSNVHSVSTDIRERSTRIEPPYNLRSAS